jgi:hypothetical protein
LFVVLANFFWFPGTTWLQSDTQIYVPIFEHLEYPAHFQKDLAAAHPHVAFTIYDEVTLALARWMGWATAGCCRCSRWHSGRAG